MLATAVAYVALTVAIASAAGPQSAPGSNATNPNCGQYSACHTCTEAPSGLCGWSSAINKCKQGTGAGPLTGSNSGWKWTNDQCTSSSADCAQYLTCGQCTQAPSGLCGWDADRAKCKQGTSNGPTMGTSSNWDWKLSQCTSSSADCSQYTTCSECTNAPSGMCGWAGDRQTCIQGSSVGPSTGSANVWEWTSDQCGDSNARCFQYTSCRSCTEAPSGQCGWDASINKCKFGTGSGPAQGTTSNWDWTSDMCAYEPTCDGAYEYCSAYTDCMTCTDAPTNNYGCGWDSSVNKCKSGSLSGPNSGSWISSNNWDWTADQCTSSTADCSQYSSCNQCTNAPSGLCGWDADRARCKQGTASGPTVGSAINWDWTTAQCTAAGPACGQFATCWSCTNAPSGLCGWDADRNLCKAGSSDGPTEGTASNWDWTSSMCSAGTDCGQYSSCRTCTEAPSGQCGWSTAMSTCVSGSSAGPNSAMTSNGWTWTTDSCPSLSSCNSNFLSYGYNWNFYFVVLCSIGGCFLLVSLVGACCGTCARRRRLRNRATVGVVASRNTDDLLSQAEPVYGTVLPGAAPSSGYVPVKSAA